MDKKYSDVIDNALNDDISKAVAKMMACSHEYKIPNVNGALALVKNYKWTKTTMKISDLEGINKPVNKEKAFNIAESIKKHKNSVEPFIVVNKLNGVYPQSLGKKILLDGHHRKEACEMIGLKEVPVYLGTFTGNAQKSTKELKERNDNMNNLEKEAGVKLNNAKNVAKNIGANVGTKINDAKNIANNVGTNVGTKLNNAKNTTKNIANNVGTKLNNAKNTTKNIANNVGTKIDDATGYIKKTKQDARYYKSHADDAESAYKYFKNNYNEHMDTARLRSRSKMADNIASNYAEAKYYRKLENEANKKLLKAYATGAGVVGAGATGAAIGIHNATKKKNKEEKTAFEMYEDFLKLAEAMPEEKLEILASEILEDIEKEAGVKKLIKKVPIVKATADYNDAKKGFNAAKKALNDIADKTTEIADKAGDALNKAYKNKALAGAALKHEVKNVGKGAVAVGGGAIAGEAIYKGVKKNKEEKTACEMYEDFLKLADELSEEELEKMSQEILYSMEKIAEDTENHSKELLMH